MAPRLPTGPRSNREPTIKEVAAKAGVSVATVSRVFNHKGPVADATTQRVIAAAQDLAYVPHGAARSLSMRRTNTVEVVLPDLHGEFFSEMIRGIDLAARRRGYHLLVSGSHSDWDEMSAVLQAVRGRVDGLIVMSPDLAARSLRAHLPTGIPVVLLNCGEDMGGNSIAIDNYGGARAMVRHLANAGHRRIAFIKGPAKNADAADRLRGYREEMAALHGSPNCRIELDGDFAEQAGYTAGLLIAEMKERPTALFAANDSMAIGALCAFQERHLRVPREIAVVGFDDIPIARFVTPPLTTVAVAIAELGRRAFELLVLALEDKTARPRTEIVPTSLVIRESCGSVTKRMPGRRSETAPRGAKKSKNRGLDRRSAKHEYT
jgi:LacI family transcriptional regulator